MLDVDDMYATAVSLVDGFNIPMRVDNNKGCHVADCPVDLNPNCPAELAGPKDSSGKVVGCKSACVAGLGDAANSPNCCTGSHNTAATCPPSGVQDYSYFSASSFHRLAFRMPHPSVRDGALTWRPGVCREKLPELVRVRLRRVLGYCPLDVRLQQGGRLHHHLLPVRRLLIHYTRTFARGKA